MATPSLTPARPRSPATQIQTSGAPTSQSTRGTTFDIESQQRDGMQLSPPPVVHMARQGQPVLQPPRGLRAQGHRVGCCPWTYAGMLGFGVAGAGTVLITLGATMSSPNAAMIAPGAVMTALGGAVAVVSCAVCIEENELDC